LSQEFPSSKKSHPPGELGFSKPYRRVALLNPLEMSKIFAKTTFPQRFSQAQAVPLFATFPAFSVRNLSA
jgi:hypothetical protein